MKSRLKHIFAGALSCMLALTLLPTAALAVNDEFPYEVRPFRVEDFTRNDGSTYVGSTELEIEVREMVMNGNTVEVSVYPAGTRFRGQGEVSLANWTAYNINGEHDPSLNNAWTAADGLPAQGVYTAEVYSIYYGFPFGSIWVTAEGSGTTEPEPDPEPEQPATVAGFSDVSSDAWYAGYVETVAEKGLFSGNEDGTFGPEDNMTYAQFLVVLSQFSGEQLPASEGAWYQSYVDWVRRAALIPEEMTSFSPDASITRQDMAALFANFLESYGGAVEPVNEGTASFTDAASIAGYATGGVQTCYELGLMSGNEDGTFAPLDTATRAEVAVTMTQMARIMGR